ncbi:MAG: hypothetical protein Q9213_007345 [Squamulea squamosa]
MAQQLLLHRLLDERDALVRKHVVLSPVRTRSHIARISRSSPEISRVSMTFATYSYFMRQIQTVVPHVSRGRRCQSFNLPSFKELEARGDFLPEPKVLSAGREHTLNTATSLTRWDERSANSSLGRWPMPLACGLDKAQPQDKRFVPESNGNHARFASESYIFQREESSRRTSSDADRPDDGRLASGIESIIRRHWAEETGPPPTVSPHKRPGEPEILAQKTRGCERGPSPNKRFKKQEKNRAVAVAHMEKERERRLHIGDLIQHLASQIKFDGPKVEILRRTVDCINVAKSRREDLEAKLEDLRYKYQTLSERYSKVLRVCDSCANAEGAYFGNLSWTKKIHQKRAKVVV